MNDQSATAMDSSLDYAYRVSCGRLIFERNGLNRLPDELSRLGKKPFLIGGQKALKCVGAQIYARLKSQNIPCISTVHTGPCNEEDARLLAGECKKNGCDVVIGVGGGKIMDFAKIVAHMTQNQLLLIPTIAATCAAMTPMSVVYDREGRCRGTWHYRRIVACVVCDLDIVCREAPRYLKSGTLDAMAKMIEIRFHTEHAAQIAEPDLRMAKLIAENAYRELAECLPKALEGDRAASETCVFHNMVTAGLVSGIARGKFQAAIGHAFYESVRACHPIASASWLHGEIVAVGLLAQELYLGHEESYAALSQFMRRFGMPASWTEIGLPGTQEAVCALCGVPRMKSEYRSPETDGDRLASLILSRML